MKLRTLILDTDCDSDPRLKALAGEFGMVSLCWFPLLNAMAREGGAIHIEIAKHCGIMYGAKTEDVLRFIHRAVELDLIQNNDGVLSSRRLTRDVERMETKQELHRQRQAKYKAKTLPNYADDAEVRVADASPLNIEQRTKNIELEQEGVQGEGEKPPPLPDPEPPKDPELARHWGAALESLARPTGFELWEKSNAFICTGKRPLKNHPDLWLTPLELAQVLSEFEDSGLEFKHFKLAIAKAKARITAQKLQHRRADTVPVASWLSSWIKREVLDEVTASARMRRATGQEAQL